MAEVSANREVKATVFSDLFDSKEAQLALYRVLHPEDTTTTADDIEKISLTHIFVRGAYNDLGLLVGNRLMILVEAQSTWSVNIIPRCIMYLASTWNQVALEKKLDWYSARKVPLPEAELFVIYTGNREIPQKVITLSEEFFDGRPTDLDARVHVITYEGDHDIIDQYIFFCKTQDEQRKLYPLDSRKAIAETIRICKERDMLRAYLEKRGQEVISIMLTLFDQQQALDMAMASERREGRAEGRAEGRVEGRETQAKESAFNMHKSGLGYEDIAKYIGFAVDTVKDWLKGCD